MKAVILAGGMGTRISEESQMRPKPMIEIGGKPILWHIMKLYSSYGINDFIICCGYKGYMIKEYFVNYHKYQTDTTFCLKDDTQIDHKNNIEPWKVTLIDTGLKTMTAGRILRIRDYLNDAPFCLTYGDGVADINIAALLSYHNKNKKIVTITATRPDGRFGAIKLSENTGEIQGFKEKARKDQAWVNAGFMVMEPEVFSYLGDGDEMLEAGPFERLAEQNRMDAYFHEGFWSPMDTIHDKQFLENLWKSGRAPWKIW
ncbi:glucose-1-phosphate cytidylyltransferase [Eisenbergiella tayi]|uniref:glucose-1-phosphate cytidylyltransferase n=1 Tax=Eisenbergiella tayi TaxID=1432052 RepID=UPI000848DD05|nr:glucose-1-phosphate cytidylyltransferase [Eisenbergiella tayi]ODR36031.1 glucose-1-phosphate cytidylyltransferase [Eisenbergiella tayi]